MKQKQRRTKIIGALIFVVLVAVAGFGLVATGNFHNPFDFLGGDRGGPGAPVSQVANNNTGRGSGAPAFQATNNNVGRGQRFAPDRAGFRGGPGGDPDGGNNNGIAWKQIGGVFFELWFLSAVVACYILVQQILG